MLSKRKYKQNIRAVFERAKTSEITSGVYWYDEARRVAEEISGEFRIPVETVCMVISALSPNNSWTRNITDAWKVTRAWFEYSRKPYLTIAEREAAIKRCITCTYPANKQKAFDILDGFRTELNGLKTKNFAANLAGCTESVTVDVHAFSIANAKRFKAKTMKPITPKVYEAIKTAFVDAAKEIGIAPAHLQAITWQTWRRIHGLASPQELNGRLF